jgi:hypothetical protein
MLQNSMAQRRPKSELKSIVLYNKIDDQGKWVYDAIIYWVMGNNETINNWKPWNKKKDVCKTLTSIGKVW